MISIAKRLIISEYETKREKRKNTRKIKYKLYSHSKCAFENEQEGYLHYFCSKREFEIGALIETIDGKLIFIELLNHEGEELQNSQFANLTFID